MSAGQHAVPRSGSSAEASTAAAPSALERRGITGSAAEQALALYRLIFVKSTEAIAIIDADGTYLEQNAAHRALLEYSDEELRGRSPALHVGEEEFRSIAAELRATGVCRRECVSRTKSGKLRDVEISAFAVHGAAGDPVCYVGIKRDVTEARRAAAELQRQFDELQAIYRMADTVGRAGALEEIYDAALDELLQTVRADRASVLLFDDDDVMRFKAWRGLSDAYRRAVEGHSPWQRDSVDPQPILVSDVHADSTLAALRPVFDREGIRALGFIPLVDAGRLVGKFMLYFDAPQELSSSALRLAQTIARHIAFAITRARSDAAMRENVRSERLLAQAGEILNSSLEYADTLRSITQLAVPDVADWCMVDLLVEDGSFECIAVAAAMPQDQPLARQLHRRHVASPDVQYGPSRVVRSGRSELVDVDDEYLSVLADSEDQMAALRASGITSAIVVPLTTRGRTFGAVTFAVGSSGRRYGERDLLLSEELGRRAAIAIDNARLYREAQEANRAKSQFLATMSHELRTPLNAIGGYTELLQLGLRGPITDAQRDDLARIQRSQRHLLGLITDLLNFARIESGHLELHVHDFILTETLEEVHALIAPQVAAKGLRFRQIPGDPSLRCLADRDKVQQVLLNLLSNAVKFTPAGGEVTLETVQADGELRIHVRDTGPGIPAPMLETIFEPFVQLRSGTTRASEGTGLGLSISRELARAMRGEVTVSSAVGHGSIFTLMLPRA